MTKFYYIAIYPPQNIIDEIREFKEDIAKNFNSVKALKNDAHITLLPPFSRELSLEQDIHIAFKKIDTNFSPFEIELNGFSNFPNPKNPVIFIKPEPNETLELLHLKVSEQFKFNKTSFNPHITIGYRDLTFENFENAWNKYQNLKYQRKFQVEKILLLRHDGSWTKIAEKLLF